MKNITETDNLVALEGPIRVDKILEAQERSVAATISR